MSKYIHYIFATLLICCFACSTNKTAIDPNIPSWAKSIVSVPGYYTGVGYAPKQKSSASHYVNAEKNALNALASEISVDISSNTVLVTTDNAGNAKDDIKSIIQARTTKSIEGYEKVDSYESKTGYWVYYRLNKEFHAQNERTKKEKATNTTIRKFKLAYIAEENHDIKNAIILYSECLNTIIEYINSPINHTINGKSYEIISESYSRINNILDNINIEIANDELECNFGSSLSEDIISCTITYKEHSVKNLPITISYSGELSHKKTLTNEYGKASSELHIKSDKDEETITFSIDKNEFLKQTTIDYAIRKWILQTPTKNKVIKLKITKPNIYINALNNAKIKTALESQLSNKLYPITQDLHDADYIVHLKTSHKGTKNNNGIYTVLLDGELSVNKYNSKTIYTKRISTIKGMHLNYQEALNNTYNILAQQIEKQLYKEVNNAIKNAQ